jgi:hypothetical protein
VLAHMQRECGGRVSVLLIKLSARASTRDVACPVQKDGTVICTSLSLSPLNFIWRISVKRVNSIIGQIIRLYLVKCRIIIMKDIVGHQI